MMDAEAYTMKQRERFIERQWINSIIRQGGCCWMCGYKDDPYIIEQHHFAGKNNSIITISTCPNHHRILSLYQKSWDPRWMHHNNNDRLKLAFQLRGISDILKVFSRLSKELSEEILEDKEEKKEDKK